MIPELVGRLPVTASLEPVDHGALLEVLTRPRNALVKQFQRLFEMDGVQLEFTPDALSAAADRALKHETGARGLRAIIEGVLLDVMYEIPSRPEVRHVLVTDKTIRGQASPVLLDTS